MKRAAVNIGIVGHGFAGSVLHPALIARVEGLRLHAVATRDEDRRKSAEVAHGVRTFTSLGEMLLDEAVELVVIATPHDTHEELVVQALRAGRHVICEKVMTLTTASADRMIAAASESGKLLSVFQNRRWDGDFMTVQHAVQSGLLGRLRFLEIAIHTHKFPRTWRNSVERSGGLLFDWGAHLVDQALQLMTAKVVGVSGFSQRAGEADSTGREVLSRCHIRFETGQFAAIEVSYASYLGREHWFLCGDEGSLLKDGLDPQEAALRSGNLEQAKEDREERARARVRLAGQMVDMRLDTIPGRWVAFYENVRDVLHGTASPKVTLAEAREVVAVLDAHARAVREGREVAFPETGKF